MQHRVVSHPPLDLSSLDPESADFVKACEPLDVVVQTWAGNSILSRIHQGSTWYADKYADCHCAEISLVRFADDAYTICHEHGLHAIGTLRREIPSNGRGR